MSRYSTEWTWFIWQSQCYLMLWIRTTLTVLKHQRWTQTVGGTFFFTRGSSASTSSLLSAPLETVNVNKQQSSFTCTNHELSDIMTELLTISNRTMSNNDQHKPIAIDWIEQSFTSPPTQYKLYGRRFLQVKRPNQPCQSTEGTYSTGADPSCWGCKERTSQSN